MLSKWPEKTFYICFSDVVSDDSPYFAWTIHFHQKTFEDKSNHFLSHVKNNRETDFPLSWRVYSHFNGAEWSHFSNLLKVQAWLSVWIVPLISKEVFISLMRGTLGKGRLNQSWSRTQSLSSFCSGTSHHAPFYLYHLPKLSKRVTRLQVPGPKHNNPTYNGLPDRCSALLNR